MKYVSLYVALALIISQPSFADNGLISFEINVQQQVANNEAVAILSKTATAKTPKALAQQITPTINHALMLAKSYPSIQANTDKQTSYPQYDKNGKMTGFFGSSSIKLTSQNTDDLAELIGKLQGHLTLQDLSFYVSDDIKAQVENQLMRDATQKFQDKAQSLAQAWQANGYQLVNAQMNTNNNHYPPMPMAVAAYAASEATSHYTPTLNVGNSTISYTIQGTIKLTSKSNAD